MKWRMPSPCADCPFNESGPGRHLRRTLRPGRWREILRALRNDQHFTCHKTTEETGDGSNLVCAGALAWQAARGLSSNYERVMERLAAAFAADTKNAGRAGVRGEEGKHRQGGR